MEKYTRLYKLITVNKIYIEIIEPYFKVLLIRD